MKKGRQVKSMRGVPVDFDLMDIKSQMANQPKNTDVKAREDFIESRLNRRAARRAARIAEEAKKKAEAEQAEAEKVEAEQADPTPEAPKQSTTKVVEKTVEPQVSEDVINSEPPKPKTRRIKKKPIEDVEE